MGGDTTGFLCVAHSVDQAELKLMSLPALASKVLWLKVYTIMIGYHQYSKLRNSTVRNSGFSIVSKIH